MKSALEKFIEGATTIVESPKKGVQPTPPILVICPDPPFKKSYFKEHDLVDPGIEKYFWHTVGFLLIYLCWKDKY